MHDTPPQSRSFFQRLRHRIDRLAVITVVIPTLIAAVYFGAFASDVFISEARFVVRNPQRTTQSGLGALLQGTAFSRSQDDTYSVHDFIRSRDALRELDEKLQVRSAYSAPSISFLNRFPGLSWWDKSFEAFHRYYLDHIGVDYDTVSSISILRVRAYTAEDARRINDLLLQMGERLVNNLNIRSRRDLIEVAEREVSKAEERAKNAAQALAGFRSSRSVFDPDRQGAIQLQGVARLQEELMAVESQLTQLRQVSPSNPQVATLSTRAQSLRQSIANETAKVMGGDSSLTAKSPAFDRLVLERTYADRQLATALASLDTARSEAQRKQLYLERLVQPNLPDMAVEPKRLRSIFMVFMVGLIVWAVSSLVLASVREHTD